MEDEASTSTPSTHRPEAPDGNESTEQESAEVQGQEVDEEIGQRDNNDELVDLSSDEEEGNQLQPSAILDNNDSFRQELRRRRSKRLVSEFQNSLRATVSFADDAAAAAGSEQPDNPKWWQPFGWSVFRCKITALGCLSSSVVLGVRLMLDLRPTAYLIHSIIVFFDMILIHLFTKSCWLSALGEFVTVVFVVCFHLTKETVFELMETTMLAVLCSFHLVASRNKHKARGEELQTGIQTLRRQTLVMLQSFDQIIDEEPENEDIKLDSIPAPAVSPEPLSWLSSESWHKSQQEVRRRAVWCGGCFFEHFLDGSAGVMYTSFLGLIIDELLTYGRDSGCY